MKSKVLKSVKNNKVIFFFTIIFVLLIIFLIRQKIINKGMKIIIDNFNNSDKCSELNQYDCTFVPGCVYIVETNSCVNDMNRIEEQREPVSGSTLTNNQTSTNNNQTSTNNNQTSTTTTQASTTTTQASTTTTQASTTTTTQASTISTQQETTTTQPVSNNNDNNSDEEDVLIEEESFLPLIFSGENNIYTSQYYGFGNLFSPHTEIYNY